MELINDQIHAPAFQKLSDYIWMENWANDYENSVIKNHNPKLKPINRGNFNNADMKSGVIFVGMCHILEDILHDLPKDGNYIIIHRTNDRPFTQKMVDNKPESVKHIYTVDCRGNWEGVTAIPFGVSSIMGEDEILKEVYKEKVKKVNKIFCRYNVNRDTFHRNESLPFMRNNPLVNFTEEQIGQKDFHRQTKAHKYTMALAGCGADASRQWSSMILGSIPIVTDCPEMRQFSDMPLLFCPPFEELNKKWLSLQSIEGKSTSRLKMSYWELHLKEMRLRHGI